MRRHVRSPVPRWLLVRPSYETGCNLSRGTQKVAHERIDQPNILPYAHINVEETTSWITGYVYPPASGNVEGFEKNIAMRPTVCIFMQTVKLSTYIVTTEKDIPLGRSGWSRYNLTDSCATFKPHYKSFFFPVTYFKDWPRENHSDASLTLEGCTLRIYCIACVHKKSCTMRRNNLHHGEL